MTVQNSDEIDLKYVTDSIPGITRVPYKDGFQYKSPQHDQIQDRNIIQRIDSLAIPPAYEKVWICPFENGHIQATGFDDAGRKQYRYHPYWREYRDREKYSRLVEFGTILPRIRRNISRIFRNESAVDSLSKDFVCAALVRLLDNAPLRIGNLRNEKARGATTLTSKNIRMDDDTLRLDYIAKGGKRIRRQVKDQRLLKTLSAIDDLPGKSLFQYVGTDGEVYALDSGDVNQWLKDRSGSDNISAKVFRTWHGSVAALRYVRRADKPTIKETCEEAAKLLKNTPAICRSSYIHPAIIDLVQADKQKRSDLKKLAENPLRGLRADERILLRFLEKADEK